MLRKRALDKLRKPPKKVRQWVEKYKDVPIVSVQVCREPVNTIYQKVANLMTLGRWNEVKEKYNYDDIFHLFLRIDLANGKSYTIEKNQRVSLKSGKRNRGVGMECMPAETVNIPLGEFIDKGVRRGGREFWRYRADVDNCQKFVSDLLTANGITKFNSFISQDTRSLLGPGTRKVIQALSDVAGTVERVVQGGGTVGVVGDFVYEELHPALIF